MGPLLAIDDLRISYRTARGEARAVDGVSLSVSAGEYLGLVGESGCGKSTIAKAILGILPPNGRVNGGAIRFDGQDLLALAPADLRALLWRRLALVPQSAMNGFDPVFTVGSQIDEAIRYHVDLPKAERRGRIEELFAMVGIDANRIGDYPHQYSGGMRQRAMIAMAMALDPDMIVADEPTTGLDVIVQDQIMRRIREIHLERKKTMLLITHDMALVAENCDKIAVMYAGRLVEYGGSGVFLTPFHPYTLGLCNAFPDFGAVGRDLISIPGSPPDLVDPPSGCRFAERCPFADGRCQGTEPQLVEVSPGHLVACHFSDRAEEFRRLAGNGDIWRAERPR